ncbi:MAG: hypothetical protein GX801_02020 [Fibrobacter sp.]|nr:hypothetical protein [Fibrobacter sp.]
MFSLLVLSFLGCQSDGNQVMGNDYSDTPPPDVSDTIVEDKITDTDANGADSIGIVDTVGLKDNDTIIEPNETDTIPNSHHLYESIDQALIEENLQKWLISKPQNYSFTMKFIDDEGESEGMFLCGEQGCELVGGTLFDETYADITDMEAEIEEAVDANFLGYLLQAFVMLEELMKEFAELDESIELEMLPLDLEIKYGFNPDYGFVSYFEFTELDSDIPVTGEIYDFKTL